jgi:hypothetical protein
MRRIMTLLALALCLLGCDAGVLPRDRVALRTSDTDTIGAPCFLSGWESELILDPRSGLAWSAGPDDIRPVIWPRGFTARRIGSEVEVLDRDGEVVATTGRKVEVTYTKMESGLVFACG